MLRAVRMAAPKLMLSLAVIAGISGGNARRAQAQSADIPLQLISFGTGSSQNILSASMSALAQARRNRTCSIRVLLRSMPL